MKMVEVKKSELCTRKRRLLDYFEQQGLPYMATVIDREAVLHRKLNGNYDVEISGGFYQRPFCVYLWALTGNGFAAYTVADYTVPSGDIPAAAAAIGAIVDEYKNLHARTVS